MGIAGDPPHALGGNRSFAVAVRAGLIVAMIVGLIFGLSFGTGLFGAGPHTLRGNLGYGLVSGLVSGLGVGLFCGGMFALKHTVLRLLLWMSGVTPLCYVVFLRNAKELLFLRQVGAGYVFIHRLLQEYFVSLL